MQNTLKIGIPILALVAAANSAVAQMGWGCLNSGNGACHTGGPYGSCSWCWDNDKYPQTGVGCGYPAYPAPVTDPGSCVLFT